MMQNNIKCESLHLKKLFQYVNRFIRNIARAPLRISYHLVQKIFEKGGRNGRYREDTKETNQDY
jgi:hypothetical protein